MKSGIYFIIFLFFFLLKAKEVTAQDESSMFKMKTLATSTTKPVHYYEVLCTKKGTIFSSTSVGIIEDAGVIGYLPSYLSVDETEKKRSRSYKAEDSIKSICEGIGNCIFCATYDNKIFWFSYDSNIEAWAPSFDFPGSKRSAIVIAKIWSDNEGTLFIGTKSNGFYVVAKGADQKDFPKTWKELSALGEKSSTQLLPVKENMTKANLGVYCFYQDALNKEIVWVGTDHGLAMYNKMTNQSKIFWTPPASDSLVTITNIETDRKNNIWFSTLEKGMGFYDQEKKTCRFFYYSKNEHSNKTLYPIKTFCRKSENEFFVAVADSVPAIFSLETGTYNFLADTIFHNTPNNTTDIKIDALGNLFVIKGGGFYYTQAFAKSRTFASVKIDSTAFGPYVWSININGRNYIDISGNLRHPKYLKEIKLDYDQNDIEINYSIIEFDDIRNINFEWKLEGYINEWVSSPFNNQKESDIARFYKLNPGKYIFHLRAKSVNENWRKQEAQLIIIISPPFWQTWWFWLSVVAGISVITFAAVKWRVSTVRKQERIKAKYEKEALELEAKALRAQMNPHFIFNCMNSIKSLIQQKNEDKAVNYLTTFSKLLRTVFNNSDKREVTLYDEIETCRLYTQLESMRFGNKFTYAFNVDETIDMKSVMIPALIIQPFIENAIWHGIMPKESDGRLQVSVDKKENAICCTIDDNGIGREMSKQNKFRDGSSTHQSKGVHLTQSRLDLDNLLNERKASVEIIDKTDEAGKATGTTVTLTFKEY